jgi:predicted nucleic acid-binding protein
VSVKRIVIDASVALKWRLDDEDAKDEARAMLRDFLDGRIELIAPGLFDYEVTNALKVAVVRGRIGEQDALNAITAYQSLGIERFDLRPLLVATFQLANQYQRSVYDAAYLVLAQTEGVDLYTGDKRLFNAVSNALTWVKWIGDY